MGNVFLNRSDHIVTKVVLVCHVPSRKRTLTVKARPAHGIAFVADGKRKYVFEDGSSYLVEKNDVIYIPKNSSYKVIIIIPGSVYYMDFSLSERERFLPFCLHVKKDQKILEAFISAQKSWQLNENSVQFKCKAELYKIFYELNVQYFMPYVPETKRNLLEPAIEYINKNYTNEIINIEKLSELCGISYEYFRRLFKNFYGYSPIKYINELKLKRAKELLNSGVCTVSEVAMLSGFSNISFFSRYFKKEVGVPPSEYLS